VNHDDVLPCDVMLPPNTIIRRGCKLSTLLEAMAHRREQLPDKTTFSDPLGPDNVRDDGGERR
jgi:hypothetical protein